MRWYSLFLLLGGCVLNVMSMESQQGRSEMRRSGTMDDLQGFYLMVQMKEQFLVEQRRQQERGESSVGEQRRIVRAKRTRQKQNS